jgi:putative DNA-invertase from lambdoid prophage Rac
VEIRTISSLAPWQAFRAVSLRTVRISKLDRLGRDAHDVGGTIKLLASRGIKVIVLQLGALDLTSPAGKMMLTMLAAVAELERDLLVERTQAGLQWAKQQGKVLGRPATTTDEQRANILAWYKAVTNISELSRVHGVSCMTIMRITRQGNIYTDV